MSKNRRTAPAKPVTTKTEVEKAAHDIRRATRKVHDAEGSEQVKLLVRESPRTHIVRF